MDRVRGVVLGQALADALGAYTEHYSEEQLKSLYPTHDDYIFPPTYVSHMTPNRNKYVYIAITIIARDVGRK